MDGNNFTLRLSRIRKALRSEFESRAAPLDITVPQFQVLRRLWEGDGVLTSVVAKDICSSSSTLTGLLDRLESKGLVERRPSSDDRRAMYIWLKEAGKDLQQPLMDIIKEIDEKALAGFSDNQKNQFLKALEKVGNNLES